MSHHREPVPHTCPDIDKIIKAIRKIQKECNSRVISYSEDIEDFKSIISDIESECWGLEDELEKLRKSNDKLRCWGVSEAEEVDKLEETIYNKQNQQ